MYSAGSRCKSIVGQASVSFGNFTLAKKYYVQFKKEGEDTYTVLMYKDKQYIRLCHKEVFTGLDFCGLDWGTFDTQKVLCNWFYLPPKYKTFVTIITKVRPITLLFTSEVQMNYWKDELKNCLYEGGHYIRQYLRLGDENVLLQVGKSNLCLTEPRVGPEPARVLRGQCWGRAAFDRCDARGPWLTLVMKHPESPTPTTVDLQCERSGMIYGKYQSQVEILRQIWEDIYNWAVTYNIVDSKIYEGLYHVIPHDRMENFYNLNELDDKDEAEYQSRENIINAYRKYKDNATELNSMDRRILTTGFVISKILNNPPEDTLQLSENIRAEICLSLYSDSQLGKSSDWTALASLIGIKQNAISKINAMFIEESPRIHKAEIILRHWQFLYNADRHKKEPIPGAPKIPCTKLGLMEALTTIGQHNLAALVRSTLPETEVLYERIPVNNEN